MIEMGRVARKYPQGRFSLRTPVNADEEKLYPIYLCYFCEGKKIRYSTGIQTMGKDWNPNANHGIGELRASFGPDYRKKNLTLQKLLRKVDNCIFEYVEQNGKISPDIIQGFICGDDRPLRADKGQNFSSYALNVLEKQYNRRKIRIPTYKNSVSILNQFKIFLGEKEGEKEGELYIGDITEELVRDFLVWGLERGRKTNTVEKYLETINKICKQASEEELLCKTSAQAIADIVLETNLDESSSRSIKYLTPDEMSKFFNIDRSVICDKNVDVLEMFNYSYLACGLRVSDIITLRWCDINFEKKELCKIQVKTRGRNIIPLTEKSIEILEKWKGRHNVFVFGLLPDDFNLKDEEKLRTRRNSITKSINKSLESISKKAQLGKKVTFHMARHSWAVSALEQGMSMSMISSLLGHTSTSITEKVYAEFRQDTKAEAVRNLKLCL
jgi:integrase